VHVDDEGRGELGEEHAFVHDALDALLGHYSECWHTYIDFSIYFMANWFFVFLCSTFHTFPNPPFPIMYR
jgi:hypothetical protein